MPHTWTLIFQSLDIDHVYCCPCKLGLYNWEFVVNTNCLTRDAGFRIDTEQHTHSLQQKYKQTLSSPKETFSVIMFVCSCWWNKNEGRFWYVRIELDLGQIQQTGPVNSGYKNHFKRSISENE